MIKSLVATAILVGLPVVALALAGCSSNSSDNKTAATQPPTAATTTAPTRAATSPTAAATSSAGSGAASTPSTITAVEYSFTPDKFTAKAGQPVKLTFTNAGTTSHTFTIDGGIADSGSVSPGASKAIEFTPAQAGTLTFYCMIHGKSLMSGTITVAGPGVSLPPSGPESGSAGGAGSMAAPAAAATDAYPGY